MKMSVYPSLSLVNLLFETSTLFIGKKNFLEYNFFNPSIQKFCNIYLTVSIHILSLAISLLVILLRKQRGKYTTFIGKDGHHSAV